jgi:hypothetical protein
MGDKTPAPPLPLPPAPAKVYYDGCPGCAMDRKKETQSGVPYKELLFVATTTFVSGTSTYYYILSLMLMLLLLCSAHFFIDPSIPTATQHVVRGRTTDGLILLPACLLLSCSICVFYTSTCDSFYEIWLLFSPLLLDWTFFLLGQAGGAMAATE